MNRSILAVALTALCATTLTTSCSKDNDSTTTSSTYVTYRYEAGVTPDVVELFDISLKMTIADSEKTLTFSKTKTITDAVTGSSYKFVTTGEQLFSGSTTETIKMEYSVTPKSDWASRITTKTEWELYTYNDYEINNVAGIKYSATPVAGGTIASSKITKEILETRAQAIKSELYLGK